MKSWKFVPRFLVALVLAVLLRHEPTTGRTAEIPEPLPGTARG